MNKKLESKPESPLDRARLKSALERVDQYLKGHCRDGWWPYCPGREPSTETTAWCLLSLAEGNPLLQSASQFLKSTQNQDGGWSSAPGKGKSDWCSGPALLATRTAQRKLSDKSLEGALKQGFDFLIDYRTEFYSPAARLLIGVIKPEELKGSRGWPWSADCFHWVEPTSYNLLAFKTPQLPDKGEYAEIVRRANAFLLESTCSAGGWNHGSHFSLGVNLPPYVVTTAEALLALQDVPEDTAVKRGFAFLDAHSEASVAGQTRSAMALAWMILAFHAYDKDTKKMMSQLIDRQNEDGSFGPNIMVTGLSALALNVENGVNPFKFSRSNAKTNPAS